MNARKVKNNSNVNGFVSCQFFLRLNFVLPKKVNSFLCFFKDNHSVWNFWINFCLTTCCWLSERLENSKSFVLPVVIFLGFFYNTDFIVFPKKFHLIVYLVTCDAFFPVNNLDYRIVNN